MGTEMARHFTMMEDLAAITDPDTAFQDAAGHALLIKSLVHSADLSGQALYVPSRRRRLKSVTLHLTLAALCGCSHRDYSISSKWGNAVLLEFADQSRREKAAGIPITVCIMPQRGLYCQSDSQILLQYCCRLTWLVSKTATAQSPQMCSKASCNTSSCHCGKQWRHSTRNCNISWITPPKIHKYC